MSYSDEDEFTAMNSSSTVGYTITNIVIVSVFSAFVFLDEILLL